MPKLVTVRRKEDVHAQAKQYVKSYILVPSGMLGLVCMLGGVGGLAYQFLASSSYSAITFLVSSGLLLVGGLCGTAQTMYHRYLLETMPEVFAARLREAIGKRGKKTRTDQQTTQIAHRGRPFVPLAYLLGVLLLFTGSAWALFEGSVDAVPAVLMPWAGFYWGKLFLWRGVVQ